MAYAQSWEGRGRRDEADSPVPEPIAAPVAPVAVPVSEPAAAAVQSPFTNAQATHEFWRLVNTGMGPVQAAQIVRMALYGVEHDWKDAGGDTGTPWAKGLAETATYGDRVNQYWQWEPFRDPNAPDPNRPYHPDPEHLKRNFGVDVGDGTQYWVEKPTDSPFAPGVLNAQGQRAGVASGGAAVVPAAVPAPTPAATIPAPVSTPAAVVPEFTYTPFKAPSYEEAMASPGFQFRLGEGTKALERSAAARGTLRTGGTLRDIMDYGQRSAAEEYQNVYNRALQDWQANYQGSKDVYAPKYGAWQTQYAGDLAKWQTGANTDLSKWTTQYGGDVSKWQTVYGGDLSKYLQREQNIYNLINTPPPTYPTWS